MNRGVSVFIADDYVIVREGLKRILKRNRNIQVTGESSNLEGLDQKIKLFQPDILIMELNLCDQPIKKLIDDLKKVSSGTRVLIVSDCACEIPVITSIRSGIAGFLKKNASEEELVKAVLEIGEGKEYFSPEITQILVKNLGRHIFQFSAREQEILKYICKGRSNEQIADILFISEKTVATHRKNIMKKAGIKKSSELILWALENKIVS